MRFGRRAPDMVSDEDDDESFGPPPPPPAYPPPPPNAGESSPPDEVRGQTGGDVSPFTDAPATSDEDDMNHGDDSGYPHPDGDKFRDEYSDDEGGHFMYGGGNTDMESRGEDPPSDTLPPARSEPDQHPIAEDDEDDDLDYENGDDQSLEIPPTSVVQRMVNKENDDKSDRQRSLMIGAAVCCCLLLATIILGVGFGTDMFTKTNTASSSNELAAEDDVSNDNDNSRSGRVRAFLMSNSLDPSAFSQADSPQNQAAQYLGSDDPLELDPTNEEDKFQLIQKFALLAGFWFVGQEDWETSGGWADVGDECSWYGIQCEEIEVDGVTQNAVTIINLYENNLQGLSEEIGLLTYTTYLDVNSNVISGPIPSSIVKLVNLEQIFLYNNQLEGPWPSDLSPLAENLFELYASNNKFNDNVQTFFAITSLEILILDNNELTGTLEGVGGLTNIERLTLGGNQLSGEVVEELGSLQNLSTLWLYSNKLTGLIPASIGALPLLEVFDVYDNRLGDGSSGLPRVFQYTPNLSVLSLSDNNWGGRIPNEYGSWAGPLFDLRIENSNLTGSINSNLAGATSITSLRLSRNSFTRSTFPTFLFSMTQLEDLRLDGCNIEGAIPDGIDALVNLRVLFLHNNFMSGALPLRLGSLGNLERLNLSNQFFSGSIPDEWRNLASLTYLDLADNNLQGRFPFIRDMTGLETLILKGNRGLQGNLAGRYLLNVPSLVYVDLSETSIDGELNKVWSEMVNLKELRISESGLGGIIPEGLGDLENLQVLVLSDNAFVGSIPDMFSNMFSLTVLELSRNNLVGPIPSSISGAVNLRFFGVNENYDASIDFYGITGPLPTELGLLEKLSVFECKKNQINGKLPEEMGNLASLTILDISNNDLTGVVPESFASLGNLKEFFLSGNRFDPGSWVDGICEVGLEVAVPDCSLGCNPNCCGTCVNDSG